LLPVATRGLAFTPYSDSEKYSLPWDFFFGTACVVPHAATVAHIAEIASHRAVVAKDAAPYSSFICPTPLKDRYG
jgi:hypothetical protein